MNRVAWCIAMEDEAAWPQSADGRTVKSEHSVDMYGDAVEDSSYSDPDEALEGMTRLDALAQASVWRKAIMDNVGQLGINILRMAYSQSGGRKETACMVVARYIADRTGCDIYTAFDECLHDAGILKVTGHNADARDALNKATVKANKKAGKAIGL